MDRELIRLFIEKAGGDNSRIVVIPTATESPNLVNRRDVRDFLDAGAGAVTVMHATSPAEAATDQFLEPLRTATGVWFGGGRQWRLLDAYEDTPFVDLCHDVLTRGGVIGGSSAGATIQGEYLVRGHPLGNTIMMAEGYERGFAFLPGCAIDQHFTQRNRQRDLELVKRTFPQLLCIGIDEATALLVEGNEAIVAGRGTVTIYDGPRGKLPLRPALLHPGGRYDLRSASVLDTGTPHSYRQRPMTDDPRYQPGPPPSATEQPDGVIISPDTLRTGRLPAGQVRTRKWPVLHATTVPDVAPGDWSLTVQGLVDPPRVWNWKAFQALPRVRVFADFHCVTRWSRLGNLWEGVSVRELLRECHISPEARFVIVGGYDSDWTTNLPLSDFLQEDVLLADTHDGQALDPDHGGPVRLVVPRLFAWKSAKWIRSIEFTALDRRGYWERLGYHDRGDPWLGQRMWGPRIPE